MLPHPVHPRLDLSVVGIMVEFAIERIGNFAPYRRGALDDDSGIRGGIKGIEQHPVARSISDGNPGTGNVHKLPGLEGGEEDTRWIWMYPLFYTPALGCATQQQECRKWLVSANRRTAPSHKGMLVQEADAAGDRDSERQRRVQGPAALGTPPYDKGACQWVVEHSSSGGGGEVEEMSKGIDLYAMEAGSKLLVDLGFAPLLYPLAPRFPLLLALRCRGRNQLGRRTTNEDTPDLLHGYPELGYGQILRAHELARLRARTIERSTCAASACPQAQLGTTTAASLQRRR